MRKFRKSLPLLLSMTLCFTTLISLVAVPKVEAASTIINFVDLPIYETNCTGPNEKINNDYWRMRCKAKYQYSKFQFDVPSSANYKLTFEGVKGTNYGGISEIYLDGIPIGVHDFSLDDQIKGLENLYLAGGSHIIRFKAMVANSANPDTGYYQSLRKLTLTPVSSKTIEFNTYTAPTSTNASGGAELVNNDFWRVKTDLGQYSMFEFSVDETANYNLMFTGATATGYGAIVDIYMDDQLIGEHDFTTDDKTEVLFGLTLPKGKHQLKLVSTGTNSSQNLYYQYYRKLELVPAAQSSFGALANPDSNPIGGGKGYEHMVTSWTYYISPTYDSLQNLKSKVESAVPGETIYLSSDAEVLITFDTNDSANHISLLPIQVKEGVTVASGRGKVKSDGTISEGGLIKFPEMTEEGGSLELFEVIADSTATSQPRITGLRLDGTDYESREGSDPDIYYTTEAIRSLQQLSYPLEVDNNKIFGWSHAGVRTAAGHIHHNVIEKNQRTGYGYGVFVNQTNTPEGVLIEANQFNYNRHSIASDGAQNERYEARYNLILEVSRYSAFDMHGDVYSSPACNCAGDWVKIHHNTFTKIRSEAGNLRTAIGIRGRPLTGAYIYNNVFYTLDSEYNQIIQSLQNNTDYGRMFVGTNKYGTLTDEKYTTGAKKEGSPSSGTYYPGIDVSY
jgi:hypothetical protein